MEDAISELRHLESKQRRRVLSVRLLIALFVSLIVLACVFFFGLRRIERAIAFHLEPYKIGEVWFAPAGAKDVWFVTKDGNRLHGWFFQSSAKPSNATIIYFHGNGGNVTNVGWIGKRLAARGFDALLFDYRGYGRSEGNLEDEQGLYADADAAYEYVLRERGVPPRAIVLYGQSLGTAAVADLAARRECAAIILESGPSSTSDMASVALPWLPRRLHFLARNRFDSAHKLLQVHCAVLVTHGEPDQIIPTQQGRALFAAANEPKKLVIFPGAGHNVFGSVGDKYLEMIAEFVNDVVSPGDTKK
jgi:fermentation-respiration switch protein FrsA (DUF1100 family)